MKKVKGIDMFDDKKILNDIYKKNPVKRYIIFLLGILLEALAFNMFILPTNIVYGVSGAAVILNYLFNISPAYIILLCNLLLLLMSYACLGKELTNRSILGSILYPLFIYLTSFIPRFFDYGNTEPVIIALSGAVLLGIGMGLVYKTGYTTGGTAALKQIFTIYGKKSLIYTTLAVDGVILIVCLFLMGFQPFIYSVIAYYIIGLASDKVMLGVSKHKTFQIITDKEKEVKQFILNQLHHGVTILDIKGGMYEHKKKMLLCLIPTKEYFILKEGIMKIDKNAFFIITDTYEIKGGI